MTSAPGSCTTAAAAMPVLAGGHALQQPILQAPVHQSPVLQAPVQQPASQDLAAMVAQLQQLVGQLAALSGASSGASVAAGGGVGAAPLAAQAVAALGQAQAPTFVQPAVTQPAFVQPMPAQPAVVQPAAVQPGVAQPITPQPGAQAQPTMSIPQGGLVVPSGYPGTDPAAPQGGVAGGGLGAYGLHTTGSPLYIPAESPVFFGTSQAVAGGGALGAPALAAPAVDRSSIVGTPSPGGLIDMLIRAAQPTAPLARSEGAFARVQERGGASMQIHVHGRWQQYPHLIGEGVLRGEVAMHVHPDGSLHAHDVTG